MFSHTVREPRAPPALTGKFFGAPNTILLKLYDIGKSVGQQSHRTGRTQKHFGIDYKPCRFTSKQGEIPFANVVKLCLRLGMSGNTIKTDTTGFGALPNDDHKRGEMHGVEGQFPGHAIKDGEFVFIS